MKTVIAVVIVVILLVVVAICASKPEAISLEDQNIDIVNRSFFAFAEGDWSSLAELYSPDFLQHTPDFKRSITWPEYELNCRLVHVRLPDLRYRIVDIFAAEDKVAVRSVWDVPIDPSWSKYALASINTKGTAISIFKVKNGKIVEEGCEFDPSAIKRFVSIYKRLERGK